MIVAVASSTAHLDYVLRIADSALILGQRLSEWCGHGPVIEEDIALTNTALDLIGQARLLLTHAGSLEGRGRDEDALAFLRAEHEYRSLTICELPNEDFGRTSLRNCLFAAFQMQLWQALAGSGDAQLAAIAGKSAKETRYHLQHASDWTVRLGDGTEESHARMQRALDYLWPYTAEFFSPTATDEQADRGRHRPGLVVAGHGVGSVRAAGSRGGHAEGAGENAVPFARQGRPAQRAHGPSAGGDAGPAARPSWGEVVAQC